MADGPGQQAAPALRASDADRERVTQLLGEHAAAGRLTIEELGERVDGALAAVTQPELEALLADLPGDAAPAAHAPSRPARTPSERTIAIMSGSDRKGRWRAEGKHTAIAIMGGIEIDLRQAEIVGHELEIVAFAFWGGIEIIVPEGIPVEVTSVPIMAGIDARLPDVPVLPGAPRIRIKAIAHHGRHRGQDEAEEADRAAAATGPLPPPLPPSLPALTALVRTIAAPASGPVGRPPNDEEPGPTTVGDPTAGQRVRGRSKRCPASDHRRARLMGLRPSCRDLSGSRWPLAALVRRRRRGR